MIITAIQNLTGAAPRCYTTDDMDISTLVWEDEDITRPSDENIMTEANRLKVINDYQYPRMLTYPSVEDQLDMIFHAGLGGDTFQAAIQAVKAEFPKP
jgi:hypothetical protein